MRSALGTMLFVIGVICVFLALQPWGESNYDGKRNSQIWIVRFGFTASPLITYKGDSKGGEEANPGLKVHLVSRSAAFLVAGGVMISLGLMLGKKRATAKNAVDESA
jgi:hypothetical protein